MFFGGMSALGLLVAQSERRLGWAISDIQHRDSLAEADLANLNAQVEGLRNRLESLADADRANLNEQLEGLRNRVERPSTQAEQLLRAIKGGYRRLELSQDRSAARFRDEQDRAAAKVRDDLVKHFDRVRSMGDVVSKAVSADTRETYRQIEALMALYSYTRATAGFPATRSWVASPDLLLYLHELVLRQEVELIVECGSGLSTVIMAYALRTNGRGKAVALEHLQEYGDRTNELLAQHGLSDWAEVRVVPLEPVMIENEEWPWYSVKAIPEGPVDLLFVDGPPGKLGKQARFPAAPLLIDRLSPGGLIVLDDYHRPDEREMTERWLQLYPKLVREVLRHEKGTVVLRLAGTDS